MTLKLMTYDKTGAILAAITTITETMVRWGLSFC